MSELSDAQYIGKTVVLWTSCSLSVVGSSLIIASIVKRHKAGTGLNQLLLGLSASDILASLCCALSVFSAEGIPDDLAPWSLGSSTSCSAQAFLLIWFGTSGAFYNCYVSIHFWSRVQSTRRRSSVRCHTNTYLIIAHATAILIPMFLSVAGLATDGYSANDFLAFCYFQQFDEYEESTSVSSRTGPILAAVRAAVVFMLALASICFTFSLYCKVSSNLQKTRQFTRSSLTAPGSSLSTGFSSRGNRRLSTHERLERAVAIQSLLYLIAYLNSFFFLVLVTIVSASTDSAGRRGEPGFYALIMLTCFCVPLQGAINFLIYIRPRFFAWKEADSDLSLCTLLHNAIFEEAPERQPSPRRKLRPAAHSNQFSNPLGETEIAPRTDLESNGEALESNSDNRELDDEEDSDLEGGHLMCHKECCESYRESLGLSQRAYQVRRQTTI